MAAYPSITQRIGTLREASSGIRMQRAASGKPIFARFSTQDWYAFRVQHDCNGTDKGSILSHYATHRMLEFDFVFTATGESYLTQYAERPRVTSLEGEDRWLVETYLVGTGRLPYGLAIVTTIESTVAAGESSSRGAAVPLTVVSALTATSSSVGKTGSATISGTATVLPTKRRTAAVSVTVSITESVTATGVAA